jgi:hypothetical protein
VVATTGTTWMVPPSRAIWVPPHVTHEVVIVEEAYLRTVYLDESIVPDGSTHAESSRSRACCAS